MVGAVSDDGDNRRPRLSGADKLPVLMYHAFGTAEECAAGGKYDGNGSILSIDKFREQMKWLSEQGYQGIFVSELLEYLSAGVLPPDKSVVMTFDDGYQDNYTDAYPILKEYGLKGNIAPVMMGSIRATDGLNDREPVYPRVTFPELREMIDSGVFEVGSHSYDGHGTFQIGSRTGYFFMNPKIKPRTDVFESEEEFYTPIRDDLILSKRVLAERLDIADPPYFVYPYGRYTKELEQEINRLGFPVPLSSATAMSPPPPTVTFCLASPSARRLKPRNSSKSCKASVQHGNGAGCRRRRKKGWKNFVES